MQLLLLLPLLWKWLLLLLVLVPVQLLLQLLLVVVLLVVMQLLLLLVPLLGAAELHGGERLSDGNSQQWNWPKPFSWACAAGEGNWPGGSRCSTWVGLAEEECEHVHLVAEVKGRLA